MTDVVKSSEPAAKARVDWVDAAKGVSILLVVLHHTVWYLQRSGQAPAAVIAANEALASLRMPLFFLVSGLFVAAPLAAPWWVLLHRRVAFFLYLYVIWTIIRFTFFATVVPPAVDPDDSANPVELALALLLPGPSMWFLYALAVFAVVAKLIRPLPVWLQLGASGLLSALVGAGLVELGDTRWTYMSRFLFFFLLGWHARHLVQRLARATRLPWVVLGALVCVGSAGTAVVFGLRTIPGVALALQCLAVTFGVLFAAWIAQHRPGRLLVVLGRQTLPIYLIHMLWLAAVMIGLRKVDLPDAVAYLVPVVMVVVLTALSLLTHRVLIAARASWLFEMPPRVAYRTPPPQTDADRRRGALTGQRASGERQPLPAGRSPDADESTQPCPDGLPTEQRRDRGRPG